jgi:hypothetical protein
MYEGSWPIAATRRRSRRVLTRSSEIMWRGSKGRRESKGEVWKKLTREFPYWKMRRLV